MMLPKCLSDRRDFLKIAAPATAATFGVVVVPTSAWSEEKDINIIGPKAGYSPQIGTLVPMLTWMRMVVLMSVKDMSQKDLDYLFDNNANTIGSMLLRLAATETYYQMNTLDGTKWGELGRQREKEMGHADGIRRTCAQGDQRQQPELLPRHPA
ncbi:MAG TPA: hypothetical protein VKV39_19730 [Candidatus Sulfotelmatobacter sp.]|nr:hypothetical protein [Candidatus Sulfotelmatobacter sp.]